MPVPKPSSGESQSKFISRCISFLNSEGTTGDKAIAICYSQWERKNDMNESGLHSRESGVHVEHEAVSRFSDLELTVDPNMPMPKSPLEQLEDELRQP